jgi:hypothetical protein
MHQSGPILFRETRNICTLSGHRSGSSRSAKQRALLAQARGRICDLGYIATSAVGSRYRKPRTSGRDHSAFGCAAQRSVEVTLEIEACLPDGAPDNVVRTVTENARTLKFRSHGFEKE